MATLPDAPTFAEPVIVDKTTRKPSFNPIWLEWFLSVARILRTTETDHNALTNLQGGTTDEYFHLTEAQHVAFESIDAATLTFLGDPTSANLLAAMTDETGTGALVFANTPTLVTPNIGAATGTSLTATGALLSSGTAGVGYSTGAGGTVTQITNKATNVTLNKITGQVTMHNAALAAGAEVQFSILNSTVTASTDLVVMNHVSAGTFGAYSIQARTAIGGIVVSVRNVSAGSLSEAIVLSFAVIKAATS